jgi:hypothetical protein
LLAHYGLKAQAINARKAHENGDVEQSHNRFNPPRGQTEFQVNLKLGLTPCPPSCVAPAV